MCLLGIDVIVLTYKLVFYCNHGLLLGTCYDFVIAKFITIMFGPLWLLRVYSGKPVGLGSRNNIIIIIINHATNNYLFKARVEKPVKKNSLQNDYSNVLLI